MPLGINSNGFLILILFYLILTINTFFTNFLELILILILIISIIIIIIIIIIILFFFFYGTTIAEYFIANLTFVYESSTIYTSFFNRKLKIIKISKFYYIWFFI